MIEKLASDRRKWRYMILFPMILFPGALGYYYGALSIFIILAIALPFIDSNRSFVSILMAATVANFAFFFRFVGFPGVQIMWVMAASLLVASLVISANQGFSFRSLLKRNDLDDKAPR